MNVANLELCKELYEVSRWDDTSWRQCNDPLEPGDPLVFDNDEAKKWSPFDYPAYDPRLSATQAASNHLRL